MSVGTVFQFRLQCHPALSSALTLFLPTCGLQQLLSGWHFFSMLLVADFFVVGNPNRHYDWATLVWLIGLYTQCARTSKKLTDMWRQKSKWIWQAEEQGSRTWLQPMSFGEAVGQIQSISLYKHGFTELHEWETKKDDQSLEKRDIKSREWYKGTGRGKKPPKQRMFYVYI